MDLDLQLEKLIKKEVKYESTNLGLNLLISRLQKNYSSNQSPAQLKSCQQEMKAFLGKYASIMPLVADYNSVLVNVSIKSVSEENKTVDFYAPVFAGKEYRFARTVSNYVESFNERLQGFKDIKPIFSCNCVLNYLYGELDGKATPPFAGPVTFGEIAYQLLNQTLVYAEIIGK